MTTVDCLPVPVLALIVEFSTLCEAKRFYLSCSTLNESQTAVLQAQSSLTLTSASEAQYLERNLQFFTGLKTLDLAGFATPGIMEG